MPGKRPQRLRVCGTCWFGHLLLPFGSASVREDARSDRACEFPSRNCIRNSTSTSPNDRPASEASFWVHEEDVGEAGRTVERDPSEDFSFREGAAGRAGTDAGRTLTAVFFPYRSKCGASKTRDRVPPHGRELVSEPAPKRPDGAPDAEISFEGSTQDSCHPNRRGKQAENWVKNTRCR
jgi:hypothetical protein